MLYIDTRITDSSEAKLAEGAIVTMEGQAMVAVPGKGIAPATGAEGEVFAGFAMRQLCGIPLVEPYANAVEEFVIGATVTADGTEEANSSIILQFAPLSESAFVVIDKATGEAVTGCTVSGKTISGSFTIDQELKVVYKYELTNVQARAMMGDQQPGGPVGAIVGQVGLAKRGMIYTSCYDASVDWSSAKKIQLAAGGLITADKGDGSELPGAYVIAVPSAEVPFVGLEFSAA